MFTLQQVLNPLLLKDADTWVISCPGMPFGGEGMTFQEAVDDLLDQIRYQVRAFQLDEAGSELAPRIARILQVASEERIRHTVNSSWAMASKSQLVPA